jgi:peptidoglycan lytic transglycosylase
VTLRFSRLLWVILLACTFLVLGSGCAEAKTVLASWYGPGFEGQPTASGETYDPWGYTAAHQTMRFGTGLMVSYGGSSVEVTVNDRGPFVDDRELDLSQGAADAIGFTEVGVDYVQIHRTAGGGGYDPGYTGSDSYSSGAQVGGTYVVQPGDTLTSIAAALGTTVEDLAAANGIADPDLIYAGQTLYY